MGTSLSRHLMYLQPCSGDWERPLVDVEKHYLQAAQTGTYLIAFTLQLTTMRQLSEAEVKDAVLQLYRLAPSLQVCIDDRGGCPWFRKMKYDELTNLTFHQELTLELAMKHHEDMLKQTYNMRGPLWYIEVISLQQPMPGYEKNFGYVFVFGFHHSITDGTSNFTLVGHLLSLLGKNISCEVQGFPEPVFDFSPSKQTLLFMAWELLKLLANPWAKARALQEITLIAQSKLELLELSPVDPKEKTNRLIVRHFDETLTARFLSRCKQEGITVHTGFCTLINLAFVAVMAKAGLEKGKPEGFSVNSVHAINLRRYWRGGTSKGALGPHVSVYPLEQRLSSSSLAQEGFWNLATQLHKESQKNIETKDTFRQAVAFFIFEKETSLKIGVDTPPVLPYATSNMGNVDKYFPPFTLDPKSCLHLVDVVQSASANSCPFLTGITLHTFRRRLSFTVYYHTEFVTDKIANDLVDVIEDLTIKSLESST
ncbi:uncharacterized protein LOC143029501 [Oratosquilla oratoria]|uniref:uncharacterized protein LOC143029501 n=1 Tax=Oratosquilla oratoria TaxID=337810 RepID=UPI003F771BB8